MSGFAARLSVLRGPAVRDHGVNLTALHRSNRHDDLA
jgi:hypothetical protein